MPGAAAQDARRREADGVPAEGAPLRSAEIVTEAAEVLTTGCRRGRRVLERGTVPGSASGLFPLNRVLRTRSQGRG